jgi:hypothetical protein
MLLKSTIYVNHTIKAKPLKSGDAKLKGLSLSIKYASQLPKYAPPVDLWKKGGIF